MVDTGKHSFAGDFYSLPKVIFELKRCYENFEKILGVK